MKKRVLSMLLAIILCFSTLPMTAFAQDADVVTEQEEQQEADSAEEQEKQQEADSAEGQEEQQEADSAEGQEEQQEAVPVTEQKEAEAAVAPGEETSSDKSTTAEAPGTEDSTAESVSDSDAGTQDTGAADDEKKAAVQKVQALIDALPETVTVENAESVSAQLEAIDEAMAELTEEQCEELNMTRLHAISEALNAPMTVATQTGGHADHPVCGDVNCEEHGDVVTEWTPLSYKNDQLMIGDDTWNLEDVNGRNYYVLPKGNYYLENDLDISAGHGIRINENVNLCLNGHSITQNSTDYDFAVYVKNTFSLSDCSNGKGSIINKSSSAAAVFVEGTFNMYGGTITSGANVGVATSYDYNYYPGTCFNMYGGTISGSTEGVQGYNGGSFNMYGGEISGNTRGLTTSLTAGNYITFKFNIYGGTISDNTKNGIYIRRPVKVNMYGGEISGNKEGGVYILSNDVNASGDYGSPDDIEFNMYGGKISGNSGNAGGGIYMKGIDKIKVYFNMSGGEISGNNTALDGGGNVYVDNYSTLTVSGTAKIQNNWIGGTLEDGVYVKGDGKAGNVFYLSNGRKNAITIGKAGLEADASIGVTYGGTITTDTDATVATGANNGWQYGNITSDDTSYKVWQAGDDVKLTAASDLLYHPICGETCTDGSNHSTEVWKGISDPTKITSDGSYYLTGNVDLTSTWVCKYNVKLCLNGFTITGAPEYDVIKVDTDKSLDITDCKKSSGKITHASGDGHGIYVDGTLTLWNGAITGNNTSKYGGGVLVSSNGGFTMNGGEITGNKASSYGGGVFVSSGSSFTMNGGEITKNNVSSDGEGGGVCVYVLSYSSTKSKITVSGDAKITGNWKNNTEANNVYLGGTRTTTAATITIGEGLTEQAQIGVNKSSTDLEKGTVFKIATGATGTMDYTKIFTSDVSDKYFITRDSEGSLYLGMHQHSLTYVAGADGKTITAICEATGCPNQDNGGSVTINAPEERTYNGSGKAAKVTASDNWLGMAVDEITISYKDADGKELTSAPTDAGTYTASITVGGKTASVTYEIQKATPTTENFVFTVPGSLTYDGTAKTADIETATNITGMGDVTVKYYQGETEVQPINAGDYKVKISVADGSNFNAARDLTDEKWAFKINRIITEPTVELNGNTTYTGKQITPDVTVTIDGKTLTADTDYTITYGDNVNAGTNAGSVTVTAMGNYGFTDFVKNFTIKKADPELIFEKSAVTKTYSDRSQPFTNSITRKGDGKVTYSSKDTTVATVDENTGKVTIVGVGTAVITATVAATENYEKGSTSYTLTVNKAHLVVNGVIKAKDKTYDGTTDADVEVSFADENNALLYLKPDKDYTVRGTFSSPNASDSAQTVKVEITLMGDCAEKYTLENDTYKAYAYINAKPISIATVLTQNRSYERNNTSVTILGVTFKDSTDTTVTTLKSSDYTATGRMDNANSGTTKDVSVTVTLQGKAADNYKLVSNMTTAKVAITQAKGGALAEENLKQKFSDQKQKTFTPDYTGLPAGETWTYSISEAQTSGTAKVEEVTIDPAGEIAYTLTDGAENDTIRWTVTISNPNYENFTKDLVLKLTAKDPQETLRITGDDTVVYGQTLQLSTVGGSGTGEITYSVDASSTGDATIDENGVLTPVKVGSVVITATKAGDVDYSEITSAPFVIMITQAATSGEPKYHKITTGGMTLANAGLTLNGSTLNPAAGTLEWVDTDGNVLSDDTEVKVNTTYQWRFTPADTNYETLTGSIELYHVDAPAVTVQPKSVSVTVGDTATFEVAATGTDVTYQWQIDRNDGNGFVDITGATGATYTTGVTDIDCNGFKYRCVLSNAADSVTTDTVVLTVQYQIIEGANGSWNQSTDGNGSLRIRGNGEISKFQNVKVDGNIIDSKNYTPSEGSTIIELHADYLKTLSEGSHTFEIVWTDGAAGTSFTVARNTSGSNNTGSNNTGNNDNNDSADNSAAAAPTAATAQELDKVPATGDPFGIWLTLFAISLTGLSVMLVRRKKG